MKSRTIRFSIEFHGSVEVLHLVPAHDRLAPWLVEPLAAEDLDGVRRKIWHPIPDVVVQDAEHGQDHVRAVATLPVVFLVRDLVGDS